MLLITLLVCLASSSDEADALVKLDHDTYSGYFVSNQFEPDAKESFVVISDQKSFDQVFGAAFVMNDKSHRLPKDAFESKLVLAVIKRGNAFWEYKVGGITTKGGAVQLRYVATSKRTPDTQFACPLIVSVPKGAYTTMTFIENRKALKTVTLPIAAR